MEDKDWKIGSTVIANITDFGITEGSNYTVLSYGYFGGNFVIVDDTGYMVEYSEDYFRVVKDYKMERIKLDTANKVGEIMEIMTDKINIQEVHREDVYVMAVDLLYKSMTKMKNEENDTLKCHSHMAIELNTKKMVIQQWDIWKCKRK